MARVPDRPSIPAHEIPTRNAATADARAMTERLLHGCLKASVADVVEAGLELLPDFELAAIPMLDGQERPAEVPTVRRRLRAEGIRVVEHRGVLLLTARDLQYRATRFASAILGTAVVFTMVFLMTGVTEQFHREPREVVRVLGSDAWLLREGASGAFTSSETLPTDVARRIRGVEVASLVTARHSITQTGEAGRTDVVVAGSGPMEFEKSSAQWSIRPSRSGCGAAREFRPNFGSS